MGAKIKKKFNDMKLGQKLMAAFVLVSIIPIVTIQIISYVANADTLKRKIDTLMVDNLTQLSERVDLTMDIYTNLVYQIYVDDKVIENVNVLLSDDKEKKEIAFSQIYDRLRQSENSVQGVRSISIICANGEAVTYDAKTGSSIENLWSGYSDLREIAPCTNAAGEPGMVITPTMRFTENGEDEYYFCVSKCMYDYNDMEKGTIATIVMSVDEEVLRNICSVAAASNEAEYNVNFITDKEGNVISYPDSFYTGIHMNPELTVPQFVEVTGLLQGRETAVNQYANEEMGWIFYNVYDRDYMMRDVRKTFVLFVVVSIFAILFSSILIAYIVKQIGKSVQEIIGGIQTVQKGNLDVQVEVMGQDELGQIARNFNDMTGRLRELIAEVTLANEQQKNAEIRALEAQINPHFLYNTLDSINWMAIEKEEYEISRMLRNLGVILRYSVNKSNQMVTAGEMADWLDKYVSLQQMRFNNSFRLEMNIMEEAKPFRIYKLLIQPFVENAIIHGFKEMESGGLLRVDMFLSEKEDRLNIIIEDNGKGMAAEKVAVFNDRGRAVKDEGERIGLHNAFARIDMYYGGEAFWNVNSIDGMGTVITLSIPSETRKLV